MPTKALNASVISFFNELSKPEYVPVKDRLVEMELIKDCLVGKDAQSFQTLIKRNLRFVAKVAVKYMDGGDHDVDIFHAGVLGLATSIRRYDTNSNCRLITYARAWIEHEIRQCIRNKSVIRLTHYMCWRSKQVEAVIDGLRRDGQAHADEDVSSATGITKKGVASARMARKSQYVMDHFPGHSHKRENDTPDDEMGNDAYMNLLDEAREPIDDLISGENSTRLRSILAKLPGNEELVIRKLYFDDNCTGESYRSLAAQMGCSYEQVRKLKVSAFGKIALAFASNN